MFGDEIAWPITAEFDGVAELIRHEPRTRKWRWNRTAALACAVTAITLPIVFGRLFDYDWPWLGRTQGILACMGLFIVTAFAAVVCSSVCFGAARRLDTSRRARFDQQRRRQPLAWAGDGQKSRFFASTIIGKTGKTLPPLQPGGKVAIEGHTFEATSQAPYIEAGMAVIVVDTTAFGVVVRPTEASAGD